MRRLFTAKIDENGRLLLPPEIIARYGLKAGSQVFLDEINNQVFIKRSSSSLGRVYIEPTNACNLDCVTCMRNTWDEPLGTMSEAVFERILAGLNCLTPRPLVFFGGLGEPLFHPHIVEMIRRIKALGARVELITNGTLLNAERSAQLISAGLDMLWISLDGASPQSYTDVRLGASLPDVIANLRHLRLLRDTAASYYPQLGIAFVAMRRNIAELPDVLRLGLQLGVQRFSISNVLAHTPALRTEVLYERSLYNGAFHSSGNVPEVYLPRLDYDETTAPAWHELWDMSGKGLFRLHLNGGESANQSDTCPFIEKGSLAIRWDGLVSPCLPLLHTHEGFLDDHPRLSKAHAIGSVLELDLCEIWNQPAYRDLRERLQGFDFSPCTYCNSCEMASNNLEDCFGNVLPTCGGCLWAQGLIRCP